MGIIRGTTGDPDGNITVEKESLRLENLSIAMAARNSGGVVLCQVERIAEAHSLDARRVRIPGMLVDCVVVAEPEHHMQTYNSPYNPALSGELRTPLDAVAPLPLDEKKVIARRAALELNPHTTVNLGLGLPSLIGKVANEEKISDQITLTVDPGVFGGVPLDGYDFGAAMNYSASIDHPYQFDFIDGGGLDSAYLGFAQCDASGNVNASRFSGRISGCGGFINISQNSKKVVFVGTFTSGGLKARIENGQVRIEQEGKYSKFTEQVSQITFSGKVAADSGKRVLYVTERCVFVLRDEGLELTEVAPGVDIKTQILDLLPFSPIVYDPKPMLPAIFHLEPLGLRKLLHDIRIEERICYTPQTNTLFLDFSGMRVRTEEDLQRIKKAVEATLAPLDKRVYSIVNYESFWADPEIMDKYMDLVRYVEDRYYIKASRYTSSGFARLKLASGLSERDIASDVLRTHAEAQERLSES